MKGLGAAALALWLLPNAAGAQSLDGYASVMVDLLPNLQTEPEHTPVTELRTRVFAEYRRDLGRRLHLTAAGFVDGLVGRRVDDRVIRAAIARPQEAHLELRWPTVDLRLGFSRVAWGRLDEFQPTDVINPLDVTRFFLEGRSEGRMPVGMARARWMPSDRFGIEGIYVPIFRAGRYDQLDEGSAPFNIAPRLPDLPNFPVAFHRLEPAHTLGNASGGARATLTTGRVDWSVSAYRGFEPLPLYSIAFEERFPRFTMIGGDLETVRGEWGVRGEAAVFVERSLQSELGIVNGRAFEGGVGVDRKAGVYRISGNVLVSLSPLVDRTDVTLVASVDRSFARETRNIRAFAVYNPGEQSTFTRVISSFSLRDNVSLEASAGLFAGDGRDVLARFADRDFLYLRLKAFF